MSTPDDRNLALLAHLSALVVFLSIPSFVGPLVVWLWQRDRNPYVAAHAREALNFNLSVLLYAVASAIAGGLLALLTFGLALVVLVPLAFVLAVVFVVLVVGAAMRASRGEQYRYPLTIRFLQ